MRASRRSGPCCMIAVTSAVVLPMWTRSMRRWFSRVSRHVAVVAVTHPARRSAAPHERTRRFEESSIRLVYVQREVIDHEGRLIGRVFAAGEVHPDRLSLVRRDVEAL